MSNGGWHVDPWLSLPLSHCKAESVVKPELSFTVERERDWRIHTSTTMLYTVTTFVGYCMCCWIDLVIYINKPVSVYINYAFVCSIANVLNPPDGVPSSLKPMARLSVPREDQICSLAKTDKFLIVGTVGEITGWEWSSIGHNKQPKLSWTIQIPFSK